MNVGTYYGATLLDRNSTTKTNIQNKIKLEYYSMEKQIYTKSKPKILYGILIIKKEYGKHKIKCEKSKVVKVSTNKSKVRDIIKVLKDCKVTPIALEDVVEDLLKKSKCSIV